MKIAMTGDPVIDNLQNRKKILAEKIRELAYQRLKVTRQIEEIDKLIGQFEGAQAANELIQKDLETRNAINQAKAEAEAKTEG